MKLRSVVSGAAMVSVLALGALSVRSAPPNCDDCPCAMVTGVLVAQGKKSNPQFTSGFWYYVRNPNGTSGAPANNAAVVLYYTGAPQCYNVDTTVQTNPVVSLNKYTIGPPSPLPCVIQPGGPPLEIGNNMLYPAAGAAPPGTPAQWNQWKCNQS